MADMIDFDVVMPKGNEEKFLDVASRLGYGTIVFLTEDVNYKISENIRNDSRIKIKTAFLLKQTSQINIARKKFDYIFAGADRQFFESDVDFIVGLEDSLRADSFHYKSTSLNQVHAELAKKNNITLAFDFGQLPINVFTMLGRMMQNAKLVRKYKLSHATFSFARTPSEMISKATLDALDKELF